MKKPIARTEDLIVETVDDETLIYDKRNDKVHCLNRPAALVWKHCDGSTSTASLSRMMEAEFGVQNGRDLVTLAIVDLHKARLIEDIAIAEPGISRRELARRIGIGAAVALPLITSILAPTAADAASGITTTQCLAQPGSNCGLAPCIGVPGNLRCKNEPGTGNTVCVCR